jgi:hypothetical protein
LERKSPIYAAGPPYEGGNSCDKRTDQLARQVSQQSARPAGSYHLPAVGSGDGIMPEECRRVRQLGALATGIWPAPLRSGSAIGLGRVTVDWIGLLQAEPATLHRFTRDSLLSLLQRRNSDDGPRHNPIWYHIDQGYVHSGHLQLVRWEPQIPQRHVLREGQLFEVSVPFTRSYRKADPASGPLYRLYYQSTAWVTAAVVGADGRRWYQVLDELLKIHFYVRAEHLRLVPDAEMEPISPETPLHHKRIEVDLARQELFCYERDRLVFGQHLQHSPTTGRATASPSPPPAASSWSSRPRSGIWGTAI